MKRKSTLFAVTILFLVYNHSLAISQEQKANLSAEERQAVVDRISNLITENYVFLEVAEKSAEHIQGQLKAGHYDEFTEPEGFAKKLTEDLQSVNHDKHMRVRFRQPQTLAGKPEDPESARARMLRRMRAGNFGFRRVEILDGNIGYIDMRSFSAVDLGRQAAVSAMRFVTNSDALIFDMRKNGGGSPAMVQLVCSYLFGEKTHLNSLYWRRGDRTEEFWTLDEIDGKRMPDVPVFVLTSKRTFSGAEEFTYNLKTRKRAKIVGETTGGGANPGGTLRINERFGIFVPTGRAINPVTGTNWEGVGVEPDIKVEADSALAVAHKLAIEAASEYRETQIAKATQRSEERNQTLVKANALFDKNKHAEAESLINAALNQAVLSGDLNEGLINGMGYQHLQSGAPDLAVAIFKFNASRYADSPNVYDSLGDGYDKNNQLELAKQSYETAYKKGLEMHDDNVQAYKANLERVLKKISLK